MVGEKSKLIKSTLLLKSIRDMKKSLSQFVSIFIMALIAMTIVTGLDTLWVILARRSENLYDVTNVADIWVTISNPTEHDMWKVKKLEGVEHAEKRLKIDANTRFDGNPIVTVYAYPNTGILDQPYVINGGKIAKGALIDEKFALAHGIEIGDRIHVEVNGYWLQYDVTGFCISSEHVFSVAGMISSMPEPSLYGFIMTDINDTKKAFGNQAYYNQIQIILSDDADVAKLLNQLDIALGKRLINVQNHNDTLSFMTVGTQIEQFRILALVFPSMFFVVTALITLSTMMRLVEEQRNQIGIMKALGYRKKSIMWHYTSYGIYVGVLGAVFGCLLGPCLITNSQIPGLQEMYTLHNYKMSFNWTNIIVLSSFIILCTGGISAYSCYQLLAESPSELLRAKSPKKGSHIFLEKISFIWSGMKFSHKLIARNLVRNRARFLITSFGIMGCTALIFVSFTLNTTLLSTTKATYEKLFVYDDKYILNGNTSDRFCQNLNIDGEKQTMQQSGIYIKTDNHYRKSLSVTITNSEGNLINLPDENGEGRIKLPDDGIVITRKQARTMKVKAGDTVYLKRSNDTYVAVKVSYITYLKQGQGIYMSDTFYESIGETYTPTALLVKWNGEKDTIAKHFMNSDRVTSRITREQQRKDLETSLEILMMSVYILIAFGAVLAFVVIYNMGMLNFFERVRDLSTLMVLGYYNREVQLLVLVDHILSSAFGLIFGIPLGIVITNIILMFMGSDFDSTALVTVNNIIISVLLTVLFAVIVNKYLSLKMKNIVMLDALKSIE